MVCGGLRLQEELVCRKDQEVQGLLEEERRQEELSGEGGGAWFWSGLRGVFRNRLQKRIKNCLRTTFR